jgi:uncharacterized protein YndB with AHSA1/START domain
MTDFVARASMLVRRPAAEVFRAFVEPAILTRFWLQDASGPLGPGAQVTWEFMVPGAIVLVTVTAFEEPHRIAFSWSDGTSVELRFDSHAEGTRVSVEMRGFQGEGAAAAMVDATEGFSTVLCDLKTLLETGRSARLVRDKARLISDQVARPPEENALDREQLLAAEVFGYSFAHYADRLGNVRFDRLMPGRIRILEQAIRERWPRRRMADKLKATTDEVEDELSAFAQAREIVDAESPAESFRNGVRFSIQAAMKEGLGPESIEALVTQICYRAADLAFLLDMRNEPLSRYSERLRREPDPEDRDDDVRE